MAHHLRLAEFRKTGDVVAAKRRAQNRGRVGFAGGARGDVRAGSSGRRLLEEQRDAAHVRCVRRPRHGRRRLSLFDLARDITRRRHLIHLALPRHQLTPASAPASRSNSD